MSDNSLDDEIIASLESEDEPTSEALRRCVEQIKRLGIWYRLSKNAPVTSCQDAARRRKRLGHTGIPLWDELKSFLGEYTDGRGQRHIFLAHSRGDRELDLEKVQHSLEFTGEIRRLSAEAAETLGVAYGTVNPFRTDKIIQVFDQELRRPLGVPGTVMTNAGSHTWAVEVDPSELVLKLEGARWGDIVQPRVESRKFVDWGVRQPEAIGILTGNPCDSGLELCAAINSTIRRLLGKDSLGDVSMPKIIMLSKPEIGISMEMDMREAALRKALALGIEELCSSGAKIIAHPAHTTHFFAPEMSAQAAKMGASFVSMVAATSSWLHKNEIKEIALLGTRYVTDPLQKWSVYREALDGIVVHRPSEMGWKKIHDLGYAVQQTEPEPLWFNWMRDLLREEVPQTCRHVVLAMTEFSPIVKHLKEKGRRDKILVDPIQIYGEEIARRYLGISETLSGPDATVIT